MMRNIGLLVSSGRCGLYGLKNLAGLALTDTEKDDAQDRCDQPKQQDDESIVRDQGDADDEEEQHG